MTLNFLFHLYCAGHLHFVSIVQYIPLALGQLFSLQSVFFKAMVIKVRKF